MDVMSWFRVLFGITVECLLQTVAVLPVRTPDSALSCRLRQACTACMEVENLTTRMTQDRLAVGYALWNRLRAAGRSAVA